MNVAFAAGAVLAHILGVHGRQMGGVVALPR
jgi:hypothetical protein